MALTDIEKADDSADMMSKAATVVQSHFRGYKARQKVLETKKAAEFPAPSSTHTLELDDEYKDDDFHSSAGGEGAQELSNVNHATTSMMNSIKNESS